MCIAIIMQFLDGSFCCRSIMHLFQNRLTQSDSFYFPFPKQNMLMASFAHPNPPSAYHNLILFSNQEVTSVVDQNRSHVIQTLPYTLVASLFHELLHILCHTLLLVSEEHLYHQFFSHVQQYDAFKNLFSYKIEQKNKPENGFSYSDGCGVSTYAGSKDGGGWYICHLKNRFQGSSKFSRFNFLLKKESFANEGYVEETIKDLLRVLEMDPKFLKVEESLGFFSPPRSFQWTLEQSLLNQVHSENSTEFGNSGLPLN